MSRRNRRMVDQVLPGSCFVRSARPQEVPTLHEIGIETQYTESEGHPWPRMRRSGLDVGGPFYTIREKYLPRHHMVSWSSPDGSARYSGPFYMRISEDPFANDPVRTPTSTLDAWGAKAIALTDPTKSEANISQLVGELYRDGIPALIGAGLFKTRLQSAREYGSEYLNYQFGWAPLVSDVIKVAKAVKQSEKILLQLKRDSGRNVRRRFAFPQEVSTRMTQVGPFGVSNALGHSTAFFLDDATSATELVITETVDRWFSGCFTYHLDPGSDTLERFHRWSQYADKLLGLSLTPDVLWELAPWSWFADWFVSFGDCIANVSSRMQYGTVLRYGYIMEQRSLTAQYTALDPMVVKWGGGSYIHTTAKSRIIKMRQQATPFGFGLLLDSFDERQWAILAALGLSQQSGSLTW